MLAKLLSATFLTSALALASFVVLVEPAEADPMPMEHHHHHGYYDHGEHHHHHHHHHHYDHGGRD
jgi:Spy/CpxP family protein refolding chaperone